MTSKWDPALADGAQNEWRKKENKKKNWKASRNKVLGRASDSEKTVIW